MVFLNNDKLLRSTTESGRLFHIKAIRSVKNGCPSNVSNDRSVQSEWRVD